MRKPIFRAITTKNKQQKKKVSRTMDIDAEHQAMNHAFTQKRMRLIHLYLRLKRLRKLRALQRLKRLRSKRHRMMLEAFQHLFNEQLDQLEKEYQLFMVWIDQPSRKKHSIHKNHWPIDKPVAADFIEHEADPENSGLKNESIAIKAAALGYQNSLLLLSQLSKEPDSFKARVQPQRTHK